VKLAPLALLLALGCVKPPIAVPAPPPARIVRPVLRVRQLPETATTAEVLNAYVLDLAEQAGYADQLETLIWGPAPVEQK